MQNKHPTPWRVAKAGEKIGPVDDGYQSKAEDTCIVDANNEEVVGCSEWIRGEENFEYICACVNKFNGADVEKVNASEVEIWIEWKMPEPKIKIEE